LSYPGGKCPRGKRPGRKSFTHEEDGEVTWSIDQLMKSRQDATQRSSWQQRIARMGRTSAGRAKPTGALPAVRQRLRRTKTAYKVDKISESLAVREIHSTAMGCQSPCRHSITLAQWTAWCTTSDTKRIRWT